MIALIYFSWWFDFSHMGNIVLYTLLLLGEGYHVLSSLTFWFTVWPGSESQNIQKNEVGSGVSDSGYPSVAVFITVAGEPVRVVKRTALAAKNMNYPNHRVYLLNDGLVAKKENWREIIALADELDIICLTRKQPGGAKAGNINNALRQTKEGLVAIFDADMVPHPDFLSKLTPYFSDPQVGFAQSPQYYKNNDLNEVTGGAWEQQEFFFGPIMKGKNTWNAAFICGTNVLIRRQALEGVGGMNENNIAEDFYTSVLIHAKGWKSHYTTEILAEGLAPEDLLSYFKQQLRWARGNLETFFVANPVFKKGLSWSQKICYLNSTLYYFSGPVVLIDALMPLVFLFTGLLPVNVATTTFALYFLPFMFINLYTLHLVSGGRYTFRANSFSQASFTIQLLALQSILLRRKMGFSVTPKQALKGNFLFLAYPHLAYILVFIAAVGVGFLREGFDPAIITNIAWGLFNVIMFVPFIRAAYNWRSVPAYLNRELWLTG